MAKQRKERPINEITLEEHPENNIFIQLKISMFSSGLVAKIGTNNAITLMAIASYMNDKGECYPTQRQLADRLGKGKNFVNDRIADLESFMIDGEPLLTREIKKRGGVGGYANTVYKIHPEARLRFGRKKD